MHIQMFKNIIHLHKQICNECFIGAVRPNAMDYATLANRKEPSAVGEALANAGALPICASVEWIRGE